MLRVIATECNCEIIEWINPPEPRAKDLNGTTCSEGSLLGASLMRCCLFKRPLRGLPGTAASLQGISAAHAEVSQSLCQDHMSGNELILLVFRYGSLLDAERRRLILLEDMPNVHVTMREEFNAALRELLQYDLLLLLSFVNESSFVRRATYPVAILISVNFLATSEVRSLPLDIQAQCVKVK
jgi:hypothetical protein